jgi:hypothetical protein
MAVTPNSIILPQKPRCFIGAINNADGTNYKAMITAGPNGSKIVSILIASYATANTIRIVLLGRAVAYYFAVLNVPANSGLATGIPVIDAMHPSIMPALPVDSDGQRYLHLQSGDALYMGAFNAVAVNTAIESIAFGGDY